MQFDWLRVFWPTSQEQDFSQHRIWAGTQQIINIHYRTNSLKINDQILNSKNLFLAHSPIFGAKQIFQKKLGCHAQLQVCLWFWCKDLLWKIGADTQESFANLPIICLILEVKFGQAPSNNLIQQVKFSTMYLKKNFNWNMYLLL